jgi:hypothetical protein
MFVCGATLAPFLILLVLEVGKIERALVVFVLIFPACSLEIHDDVYVRAALQSGSLLSMHFYLILI